MNENRTTSLALFKKRKKKEKCCHVNRIYTSFVYHCYYNHWSALCRYVAEVTCVVKGMWKCSYWLMPIHVYIHTCHSHVTPFPTGTASDLTVSALWWFSLGIGLQCLHSLNTFTADNLVFLMQDQSQEKVKQTKTGRFLRTCFTSEYVQICNSSRKSCK